MLVLPEMLDVGVESAFAQAQKSFNEGGVPVGSALIIDKAVISVGHNQRFQKGSNILHGEMDCIEKAGHHFDLSKATLFTTLSPCLMCANTVLLFKIPEVVVLDDVNTSDFKTSIDRLKGEGVNMIIHPHTPSIDLNRKFQTDPATSGLWRGDVAL